MIGLLGGTFNPIHFGHLRMGQEIADALKLDEVRLIPSALPPHRTEPDISAEHRVAMVYLAARGNSLFRLDKREIERSGYSYTIDTLISLRHELGDSIPMFWLMGWDAFLGLPKWHRWQEILAHCHIVVADRPGTDRQSTMPEILETLLADRQLHDPATLQSTAGGHILLQDITALDIAATHIRDMFRQGLSPRYLMPDAVIDYIRTHRLYESD